MKEGYKKTEVGVIPEDWEVNLISDISEINPKKELLEDDELISFIPMEQVSNSGSILNVEKKKYEEVSKGYTPFKNNDVLLAKITPCFENGKRALVKNLDTKLGFGSTEFHVLRSNDKSIPEYLYYCISSYRFRELAKLNMTGSAGQKRVPTTFLKDYKLALPSLKEQEKIAEILSTVDCQIDDTEKLIEKCEILKKGLMQRLLSRGIGHSEFKKSEVGEIPVSWEVKKLGEICDFRQGFQISRDEQITEEKENFVRYLYITDFFSDQNKLYVKDSEKFYYINRDDIAIANTGNTCGKAFRGACGVLSNNMFKIFNDKNIIHNDYLWQYLNSDIYWKQLNKYFNTAGQPHVGHKNMSMLLIALPSIEEQINISKILSYVDKDIEIYENKKQKLEELKKGLMQQLLTGKIRVI